MARQGSAIDERTRRKGTVGRTTAQTLSTKGLIPRARVFLDYCAFYSALAVFGAMGILYTVFGTALSLILPRVAGNRLGQRVMTALFRIVTGLLTSTGIARLDLRELDTLRREESLVIVANHPSLLDAVFVVSRLPNVVCVMKASILSNPFLSGGARFAGYIRADLPVEMTRRAAAALADGRHLLVFPEGTRTVQSPVNRFTSGFALIARTAAVPVQTAFIETDTRYLAKGWPLFRKPDFPLVCRVRLGRRFPPGDETRVLAREVEDYFHAELG